MKSSSCHVCYGHPSRPFLWKLIMDKRRQVAVFRLLWSRVSMREQPCFLRVNRNDLGWFLLTLTTYFLWAVCYCFRRTNSAEACVAALVSGSSDQGGGMGRTQEQVNGNDARRRHAF